VEEQAALQWRATLREMEKARESERLRAGERENSRLRRCAKRVAKRKPTTRACPADKSPKLRLFLSSE